MTRKLSLTLGITILIFGILKFFDPFKTWYLIQIQTSGLPAISHFSGIVAEIFFGIILAAGSTVRNEKLKTSMVGIGLIGIIGIMCVATYVHLLPEVPAEALPLKIKPPIIPILFLLASAFNLFSILRSQLYLHFQRN